MRVSKQVIRAMAVDARLTGQTLYMRRCDCQWCSASNKHYFTFDTDAVLEDCPRIEMQSDFPLMDDWKEASIEAVLTMTDEGDANDGQ